MNAKPVHYWFALCTTIVFLALSFFASAQSDAVQLVKQNLSAEKTLLKLTDQDINSIVLKNEYTDPTSGIRHIYTEQKLNGLSVTGSNYSLHISGNKKADGFGLISFQSYNIKPVAVAVTSAHAISLLMDAIGYQESRIINVKQPAAGTEQLTVYSRNNSAVWDIPCRLVYYNSERLRSLIPAWEIQMMDVKKQHYWVGYIDASSGVLLDRKDLIIHCDFGAHGTVTDLAGEDHFNHPHSLIDPAKSAAYSVQPLTGNSFLGTGTTGPANKYRVYDMPFESPIDPGASHDLVTNTGDPLSSPDGWHRVANTISYQYTRGNNAWAFQDPSPGPLGGVPSADPTRTAYANNGIGGTPPLTEPFWFDYPVNLASEPETYQKAAIVNLFYWNNLMHDVFYYFGFTEDAANFQESPIFSTGNRSTRASALVNDAVLAQAQDGGGTNNANFLTLPDGAPASAQMQMYLWTASNPDSLVQITSSTSGNPPPGKKYYAIQGSFSNLPGDTTNLYTHPVLNKQFVIVQKNPLSTVGSPSEGCTAGQQSIALPPGNDVNDKIVLIDRGSCSFVEKVLGAQLGGAKGVIIINNVDGPPLAMGGTDAPANVIKIPAVMISKADGDALKAQILGGATIIGSLKRDAPPPPKRDGDIDNGVISHEYGHGISNRLTGGGGTLLPLGGDEQGGEGWSDFVAMYMTLRTNDLLPATAGHPNGVLPNRSIGNYVTYQPYDGRGIREYPYSTDMSVNPATFAYIKRSDYTDEHSVGFVWCTMLYELLQTFIDQYGMSDNVYNGANPTAGNPPAAAKGNNIATRLVIEAMKLQPNNPTFIQERNAILKADTLLYNGQHACKIWRAFAKRGLGYSAVSGTNGLGDEIESYDIPFVCDPTQKRIRIVKTGNAKVTNSGFVDYSIKVTNIFPTNITGLVVSDTLDARLTLVSASDAPVVSGQRLTWTFDLASGATKTLTVHTTVNSPTASVSIFSDDQESGPAKWDSTSVYPGTRWMYKTDASQAYSGSKYWFTPDVDLGGSNVSLTTKSKINISASSELVFFHKYATESGYDGGVVEVSADSITWNYVPPTKFVKGNYKGVIPRTNNPLIGTADLSAFSGVSPGYVVSVASLGDYAGQNIYIRFRFTSDATGGSIDNGGWWIDDVYVLNNRTEVANLAAARSDNTTPVYPDEGPNAYSTTSAFILAPAGGPLAVGLGNLSGIANNTSVSLNWKALNERSISRYEIERKTPAESDFRSIGSINARNGSADQGYVFADNNVVAGQDYLYRVKQVSANGQVLYTNIVYMRIAGKDLQVTVYPNPAQNVANLAITNPKGNEVTVLIYNVSGSKLAELKGGSGTSLNISLPVQTMKAGTYWLEIKTGNESITTRLVVSK